MYPELIRQMVLERATRFQRDAERYRQVREANLRPPRPAWTAIKLRLSACRQEFQRLARRRGATGRLTE